MVPPTHAKFPLHGLAFSGSSDPPENIENLPSPGALRLQMHAKGSDPYNFESQFLMSKINIDRCAKPVPIHKIHSHPHIRIITKLMCTLDLAVNRLP